MVDYKSGINTKRYEYNDKDGIPQAIMLRPLDPSYFPILFRVANKFKFLKKEEGETNEEFSIKMLELLDESTVKSLVDICLAVTKKSLEGISDSDANDFVSSQFLNLFPVLVKMNLNGGKKVD